MLLSSCPSIGCPITFLIACVVVYDCIVSDLYQLFFLPAVYVVTKCASGDFIFLTNSSSTMHTKTRDVIIREKNVRFFLCNIHSFL